VIICSIPDLPIPKCVIDAIIRLQRTNAVSFVVGGAVRDLILGNRVVDYDIVTTHEMATVKKIFPDAKSNFSIRGGLAWKADGIQFEITNFSDKPFNQGKNFAFNDTNLKNLLTLDAIERDFTINSLYFDVIGLRILDPISGLNDIERKLIRTVTNANENLMHQPLHMLRAIRFAKKLNFSLDSELKAAISHNAHFISRELPGRVLVEIQRQIISGYSIECLNEVCRSGLNVFIFPNLEVQLSSEKLNLLQLFLRSVDQGLLDRAMCTRTLVFSVIVWEDVFRSLPKEEKWDKDTILSAVDKALIPRVEQLDIRRILIELLHPVMTIQNQKEERIKLLRSTYPSWLNFSLLRGAAQSVGIVC